MTDAQVSELIKNAAARGREVSRRDAKVFLGAKEIMARESNSAAQMVVENFNLYITTGEKNISFAEFVLPQFETDDEKAATLAERERFLAFYEKLASIGITSGTDITMSDYEASKTFLARTGLTFEKVLEMSPEQLMAHR